ncbi:MAG: hypothetical protein GY796_14320 [Chloroflexi bacterium]|nr:hypothetical protein [Chloroflexota bacterium]
MNTIAQEFIQEGIQQGIEQGMVSAMRQNIVELLTLRLNVPETVFEEQLSQVNNLDDLRLLVRCAATVDNVEQFEQALAVLQMSDV